MNQRIKEQIAREAAHEFSKDNGLRAATEILLERAFLAAIDKATARSDWPPRSMIERARANLWDLGGWTWQEIMDVIPE